MSGISIEDYYLNSDFWIWRGFKISWHVKGLKNKYPLLLLHGFGSSGAHWRNNINFFEEKGFIVYSIDLIGFGNSEQPGIKQIRKLDNGIWCDQVTDFISEIIRPHNSEKVILIGNSLGSLVALTCAVSIPEEVSGIIASPLPDKINSSYSIETFKPNLYKFKSLIFKLFFLLMPLELILFVVNKTRLIEFGLRAAYNKQNKVDQELIKIIKRPVSRKTAAKSLRAMSIGMSVRKDNLKASYLLNLMNKTQRIPFLLIWGEKDSFIPLFLGKMIAKLYSWVELKIIPDSGHCVHDEDHKKFNKISYDWIKKLRDFY